MIAQRYHQDITTLTIIGTSLVTLMAMMGLTDGGFITPIVQALMNLSWLTIFIPLIALYVSLNRIIPSPKPTPTQQSLVKKEPVANPLSKINATQQIAVQILAETGFVSFPILQRKLKVSHLEAIRIINDLIELGIVVPAQGFEPSRIAPNSC